jgi:Protein of unknown function (DUF3592)
LIDVLPAAKDKGVTYRPEPFAWARNRKLIPCIMIGVLLTLFGLFLLGNGLVTAHYNYRFRHEAVSTSGSVSKLFWRGGSRGNTYYIAYTYRDNSGRGYWTQTLVSFEEWKSLSANGVVPVLFLPSEPLTNRLNLGDDRKHYRQEGGILPFFAAFLSLVGLGMAAAAWRAKWSESQPPIYVSHSSKVKTFHRTY